MMTTLISFYGGYVALYALLHPHTPHPAFWPLDGAALYALVGLSIGLVRHIIRLGRRAGGETLRPIPGAGIERRGRGPRRWRS